MEIDMRWISKALVAMALVAWPPCISSFAGDPVAVGDEPIVGLPCEGCEAVFQGIPERLEWKARIAPIDEPGESLFIEGTIRDARGLPAPGIVVYAYHTDSHGMYPTDETISGREAYRHGRLRGWALTDDNGRYAFETIRPAGYPGTDIPQHIHMHVIEPGCCTYSIDDICFEDDPRLTSDKRRRLAGGRGGNGVTLPVRRSDGSWAVVRDIDLGAGIPGYPGCSG